ncbi:MAG TPA: pyridoxal-phosphate dependent enzyme, partial [Candidatus Thermoplasmatota archaeon]|nr:pyridoxal-phosphate dependent enzyme [Candidatus Thermoplasmatota archaeon]
TEGIACRVYVKLENMNPGGSLKDRIGRYMIEKAEKAGRLRPGGTVVESTSGNTGVGLAVACAVKGYGLICTMPDKMSQEKINLLRGLGAKVVVTPTAVPYDDPRHYVQTAKRIARETPNALYIDQFNNPDNPEAHYRNTGPEILRQLDGKLDVFVVSMGTGGTLSGAGKYLKEKIKGLRIVGADPEGSIYTSIVKHGKPSETHVYKIEGIGHDYVPGTCDPTLLDDCITVSDRAAFQMARRLAREEGIFAGGSTGVNVVAALSVARHLPPEAVVLTFVCDTGERYLSKQWNDDWMRDNQFLEEATTLTAAGILGQRARETESLVSVPAGATVRDAIELMRQRDLSQLPVKRDGRLVGCISENQAIDLLFRRDDLATLRVEEVMGPPLPVLPADTPAEEIASMLSRGVKAVIVDKGRGELVVLTKFDLIHAGAR